MALVNKLFDYNINGNMAALNLNNPWQLDLLL